MHFRHVRIDRRQQGLLLELIAAGSAVHVAEALADGALVFEAPLQGRYAPDDLMALAQYELVDLRRQGSDWRVSVTPHGRDYAADTIIR